MQVKCDIDSCVQFLQVLYRFINIKILLLTVKTYFASVACTLCPWSAHLQYNNWQDARIRARDAATAARCVTTIELLSLLNIITTIKTSLTRSTRRKSRQ